jgi:thioesterase domain-containing protein
LFAEPTVGRLAAWIAAHRHSMPAGDATPLEPPARVGLLSHAQLRLWFVNRLDPFSPSYNIPFALAVYGPLDVFALGRALAEIVRRHQVLRTAIVLTGEEPRSIVLPAPDTILTHCDLSRTVVDQREAAIAELIRQEVRRPFDLARDLVIRAALAKLSPAEHVLIITIHHIAADGWSLDVLLQELETLYEAFRKGQPSPLDPLPLQYADFAAWQRGWLQGARLEQQRDYWLNQLQALPSLTLGSDRPRPARPSYRATYAEPFTIPAPLAGRLREVGRSTGATLFMTALAAFDVLLAQASGQDDIAVGIPIANRRRPDLNGLIGFFVNTVVVRVRMRGDPTFREIVGTVRRAALEALDHQDFPFDQLVAELEVPRSLGRNPLVQVVFNYQNPLRTKIALGEATAEFLLSASGSVRFDLEVFIREQDDGSLHVRFTGAADLFEQETIGQLAGSYRELLEGLASNPDRRLSDLRLEPGRRSLADRNRPDLAPRSLVPIQEPIREGSRVDDASGDLRAWSPLIALRSGGSKRPLFLVPDIDEDVRSLSPLASALAPDRPVFGLALPTPGSADEQVRDLDALARRYADVVDRTDPAGPLVLGGFGSGGVLALVLAQHLLERGRKVAVLVVVDGILPARARAGGLVKRIGERFRLSAGHRARLEELRAALERVQSQPYKGRIALLRSREGTADGPGSAALAAWSALVAGPVTLQPINGQRQQALVEPLVREVARLVDRCLDDASA